MPRARRNGLDDMKPSPVGINEWTINQEMVLMASSLEVFFTMFVLD
jgi:hypothetical protein